MRRFGSLLVILVLATPAMAMDQGTPPADPSPGMQQPPPPPPQGSGPGGKGIANGQMMQRHFAKMKELRVKEIEGHINILQQKLTCVQSAQNRNAIHQCVEQAKQARSVLDQQIKSQVQGLRQNK
ncbi:MAG: hypothetical protein HQL73_08005 [Magnetococcales bacterium]|nr:hypothetical protein [Magnetococcales bacterium]